MKSKKIFLPIAILIAAILGIAIFSVVYSIAKKPTVTEQEFSFTITYEFNGETQTIQDVYAVQYTENGGYTNSKTRYYVGKFRDKGDDIPFYTLKDDENGRIELLTNFHPDYLMGDPEFDYFDDETFAPQIFYYDAEGIEYSDEETLLAQGAKLIGFEYPTPIKNSFVFSHISILDNEIVFPTLVISIVAWLITLIFVKKDKDYVGKPIDVVAKIFYFLIALFLVPFITLCAQLFDAMGDNESFINQLFYFLPSLTVLGITASIGLRRKLYRKSALIAEFVCPVLFAIVFLAIVISDLL